MKLIFATHNKNKVMEVQQLLPTGIELVSLQDLGCKEHIPETADTLEGNARLKANFVAKTYHLPCFADDTGLLVDCLYGAPGVHSARYAGPNNNAAANMDKLLRAMHGAKDRNAHFKTVIALNLHGRTRFFEGRIDGHIALTKHGDKGFGYDPIFVPNGYDKTFAQLPLETKNKIGHRGKAFSKLMHHLNSIT